MENVRGGELVIFGVRFGFFETVVMAGVLLPYS
jgi:hypothetical protein